LGKDLPQAIFSFTPEIEGKAYWEDERTLVLLRPTPLPEDELSWHPESGSNLPGVRGGGPGKAGIPPGDPWPALAGIEGGFSPARGKGTGKRSISWPG